jgi:hypothetical protein
MNRELKSALRQTLDLLEAVMGHSPKWPFVRNRILRIFGRDGLERLLNGNGENQKGTVGENGNCQIEHDSR